MDVIVTHVNADFDALGGLVGAARLYPGAAMVLPGGRQPGVRDFLSLHRDVLPVRTPGEVDTEAITRVVVVDTPSRGRLGPAAAWLDLPGVEVHHYDHHAEVGDLAPTFRRVETIGSVSALLARLLQERGDVPPPVEATALLLGIYEDTGALTFAGTTAEDLEAAAWLLRCGAELEAVVEFSRHVLRPEQRRLFAELVASAETVSVRGVPVVVAVAGPGPYVEDAAVVVQRFLEAEDTAAAVVLAEMGGTLYVIARANTDTVDLGAALRELGGGGHPRAASAALHDADPAAVRERLLAALERHATPEPTAREIMSYPVRSIGSDEPVAEARLRMVRYGHSGLVVLEDGRIVGVVTRRDVDRARHHRLGHAPVRGVMTRGVRTAAPETPLSELESRMLEENIGRLPVVRGEQVIGIVTRTDVLRALHGARYLAPVRAAEEPVSQLLCERLPARLQRLLTEVGEIAAREGCEVYAVGGFVRDLLLDVRNLDVDLLVEPDALPLARALAAAHGGACKASSQFGTVQVSLPEHLKLDLATARTESYRHPGALPDVEPSSITDDLRRRDFTINALAVSLLPGRFGELLDPFGGRADLERRRIRVLHPLSFVEDPTRLFRAVRFEERFHFRMDGGTELQARHAVEEGVLGRISPERLRAEWYRTFHEPRPLGVVLRLQDLGVVQWLAPGLEVDQALFPGLRATLESLPRGAAQDRVVYLGWLFSPLGAARAVETAVERLRLPPPDARRLDAALRVLETPDTLLLLDEPPSATTRRLGGLPLEGLVLARARLLARGPEGEKPRTLLDRFLREWRDTKLEITGDDLKRLGYPPGPALGEALRATLDARLDGRVGGREAELALACSMLDRLSGPREQLPL